MIGWLILLLIGGAVLGLMRLRGVRGSMLMLCGAALLFGAAGYALQGRPGLAGSPRDAGATATPVPLTAMRHAFYGQFTSSEHWLLMSEAIARRGNLTDSVGVLKAAVREHPGDPQLWVGLGNALVDQSRGLTPASIYAYRRAAELSPGYPGPSFFFGLALLRSGQRAEAIALWRDVLAEAPAEASWRPLVEDSIAAVETP